MNKTTKLTINYAGINGMQSAVFAGLSAHGTVFLLNRGLDDSGVGLVMSLGSILAVLIQPWLADRIEQSTKWTLREYHLLLVIPSLVAMAGMLIRSQPMVLLVLQFIIAFAFLQVLTPLISSVGVLFINHGWKLNYGLCRATGSLVFAGVSSMLGVLVSRLGENVIMVTLIICYLLYIWFLMRIPIGEVSGGSNEDVVVPVPGELVEDAPGLRAFVGRYPRFLFILFGSMTFFLFHNLVNTYMIQIIENVGGSEAEMGTAIAIGAMCEIPIMLTYGWLQRWVSHRRILFMSGVFFLVKAVLMLLASSVFGMYVAMTMQLLSFGAYIIASIYYTNEVMDARDTVRGQTMLNTAHTVGGVIGNLTGGWLIQWVSVEVTLLYCVLVCGVGVVSYWFGMRRAE